MVKEEERKKIEEVRGEEEKGNEGEEKRKE
jgi:hypothetical protein